MLRREYPVVVGVTDESDALRMHLQLAEAALSISGIAGPITRVERLKGQSHITLKVERLDAEPVVLRLEPERGILPPYDVPSEARLLGVLRDAGVPVPKVLGVGRHEDRGFLVIEWVSGEVMIRRQVDADVARAYCAVLRRIHTLDWRSAGLDWLPEPSESGPALRERAEILDRLQGFGVADLPHIRRLRWALEGLAPTGISPMLVHGDVNFGNFIIERPSDPEQHLRVAAVLDWEQTHLGDPLSDWGRLAAEDLLGNLDLDDAARRTMQTALDQYGRSAEDLHYWTLHQLYKHASATAALSILRGWDINQIAATYQEPTDWLLSGSRSLERDANSRGVFQRQIPPRLGG